MRQNEQMRGYWLFESTKDVFFEEKYELGAKLGQRTYADEAACNIYQKYTDQPKTPYLRGRGLPRLTLQSTQEGKSGLVEPLKGVRLMCTCVHKGSNESWAVKVIEKKIDRKIVISEAGILLRLNHPNVYQEMDTGTAVTVIETFDSAEVTWQIRLKEIFETQTTIYLVLELVTGGELFDRIESRTHYSEKDAAFCVNQILTGVKYLHDNGVIHRDLKPENLLYEKSTAESLLKIADFGLSTIIRPQVALKTVCGTPGYCAPELLSGDGYDQAADMWSVGVIAYILLCGYEPFSGATDKEQYRNIRKANYKFEAPWWNGISINARDLIEKLLVVNPKKRLTAERALAHPWVKGVAAHGNHREDTISQIKQFNAKRKLKAATDCALVAARIANKINVADLFTPPTNLKNVSVSKLLAS